VIWHAKGKATVVTMDQILAVLTMLGFLGLAGYGLADAVKQGRRRRFVLAGLLGALSFTLGGLILMGLVIAAAWTL
jgi:hypothetical protein